MGSGMDLLLGQSVVVHVRETESLPASMELHVCCKLFKKLGKLLLRVEQDSPEDQRQRMDSHSNEVVKLTDILLQNQWGVKAEWRTT